MNRTEHLLWILAEECAEVAQRASKAARFGLEEVQAGQPLSNSRRILQEFADLLGVMELLQEEGSLPPENLRVQIDAKKLKVEKFLKYSRELGTLVDDPFQFPSDRSAPSAPSIEAVLPVAVRVGALAPADKPSPSVTWPAIPRA